jgi:hypothetical protein
MPPQKLIVNGLDMSIYNMWVETPNGWGDGPSRADRTVDVQGAGEMIVVGAGRIGARRWTVPGILIANTVQDAHDLWDAAKAWLYGAWLDVMILPYTDRVCRCRLQDAQWTQGRVEDYGLRFALTFLAPNAHLLSPLVDMYGINAGEELVLTLGTAPSPFVVELIGTATTPTLGYYDVNGQQRGSLKLSGSLAASEWWRFNSQTYAMERHDANGLTLEGAPLFSNASQLFHLDPNDGLPGRGPSLTLDSGAAVLYVRRAFQ